MTTIVTALPLTRTGPEIKSHFAQWEFQRNLIPDFHSAVVWNRIERDFRDRKNEATL